MKKTTMVKEVTTNKRYYINLTNKGNMDNYFKVLNINTNDIIDTSINDKNQLVITTNQTLVSGYEKIEIVTSYDNVTYNTPIEFCESIYSIVTISIIKSMYNSSRSWNYNSCASIVNSHYTDSIIDDLKQVCFITLWENLKDYNRILSFDVMQLNGNYKIWDSKNNTFIINTENPCNTLYLACYRSISNYLYNQKARYESKEVAIVGYDENGQNDISITVNTMAYKNYCMNQYNNLSLKAINDFQEIMLNVKLYIHSTEKQKVANICDKMLYMLELGYKKKDIQDILSISDTTVTKYYKIIQNAFYVLYKKPTNHNMNIVKIIDYKLKHNAINDMQLHRYRQLIYDNLFNASQTTNPKIDINFKGCKLVNNNHDIILDRINKYYHNQKQTMYNKLFNATKYDIKSMKLRNKHNEKMYCKELQLDRVIY